MIGLLGFDNYDELKEAHYKWVGNEITTDGSAKEKKWTESIAVGSKPFIETMRDTLGFRAKGRKITGANDTFELREVIASYGKADDQMSGNTFLWNH